MPTLILLRHGRTGANRAKILAGHTPGVDLDDTGRAQAATVATALAGLPLSAVVTSPLERCRQTVAALRAADPTLPEPVTDERFVECGYGAWTGRPLAELMKDPLWSVVQHHPSAVTFPDGESMAGVAARAHAAVLDWNARVAATHGENALWLACSHEDVIKTVVAGALGMHLDLFQRIVVDNATVTAITYTPTRSYLTRLNDRGTDLAALTPPATG